MTRGSSADAIILYTIINILHSSIYFLLCTALHCSTCCRASAAATLGLGIKVVRVKDRVQSAGHRVQGAGYRVQGTGYRVQGLVSRVQGTGSRVQCPGSRVQGTGYRV